MAPHDLAVVRFVSVYFVFAFPGFAFLVIFYFGPFGGHFLFV